MRLRLLAVCVLIFGLLCPAGRAQGKGDYRNPVLFADYSDPDVIRDGDNYYLVASTFAFVPGLPILQSNDLVHWTIVAHVLPKIHLDPKYDMTGGDRYGRGVWAPALRKHNGLFYMYFPTPDEGIFVSTAAKIAGPWSDPVAVMAGFGLEDPCPFWDDDGKAYLVHSRLGAGPLILHRMAPDGKSVLDEGKEIVRDPVHLRTLEGPKIYKRHGYYYIFAPYGGVGTGAQAVLRSKSIDGPYDYRTVLAKGKTDINGPHQGGYIETQTGEGWFLHFQSRGPHGRILHLEPVRWDDDWPVMGDAAPGEKTGQPVAYAPIPRHPGPLVAQADGQHPQTSDEFTAHELGQQWEWNHNPDDARWSLTERPGYLRLHPTAATSLFTAHNTLTQMMQDESLQFTTRLDVSGLKDGGRTGLAMFEKAASGLEVVQTGAVRTLSLFHDKDRTSGPTLTGAILQLRVHISVDKASYSYSLDDGKSFQPLGEPMPIAFSWWKGSRPALFAWTTAAGGDAGHVDFDWAHYQKADQ
ncbi:Beta-xylosidase [Granulicella rosea]|uniref:Beta-xylosidase n=1 Tax=Granulicella rosea TaxID=474952 RepID=A0A239M843_9BACT|nr:glycoside hydrolase 43 family protein [Granulicella rosea]SNT38293.1 Beta-xylosidase [Granulicella rosea]